MSEQLLYFAKYHREIAEAGPPQKVKHPNKWRAISPKDQPQEDADQ
jgi:hypothetical protein